VTVKNTGVRYPQAGLERLATGLKVLIDKGLQQRTIRIKINEKAEKVRNANEIIEKAVRACLNRSLGKLASEGRNISQQMIIELLEVFKVEGTLLETAMLLFDTYQAF
jgi:hypothetical protein